MKETPIYTVTTTAGDRFLAQSFTVQIQHINMISELLQRGVGKNYSEIVRMAIEAFYKQEAVEA